MDSMKASLRLMRSSRSISYWDLGAAGMFDGILRLRVCFACARFSRRLRGSCFACAGSGFSLRAD